MREQYVVAATRGFVIGAFVGALGFLQAWAQTDEIKLLVSSGLVPAITTWLGFLGYGAVDARRAGKA